MHQDKQEPRDELDAAIAARLRKLRSMPVDTSGLERALAMHLDPLANPSTRSRSWWAGVVKPRAVAASVALIAVLVTVVMLTTSSGPAYADPAQMATMHRELVGGTSSVMRVNSIEEAERALASELPESSGASGMPEDHVMACCLRRIEGKKISCVLLNDESVPVSLMVADGGEVKSSRTATTTVRGGLTYQVESSGDLNMVMTKRDGRWVCLIGARPVERLIELSGSMRF